MKRLTFSVLSVLCLLALYLSPAEPGQLRTTGRVFNQPRFSPGFPSATFRGSHVIIVTPGPVQVFQASPFQRIVVVPNRHFVRPTVIISHPFVCFHHHLGFFRQDFFFDHLHRVHGLGFESIPHMTVQSGPQVIFFDEGSVGLASPTEDTFTDQQ